MGRASTARAPAIWAGTALIALGPTPAPAIAVEKEFVGSVIAHVIPSGLVQIVVTCLTALDSCHSLESTARAMARAWMEIVRVISR